MLRLTEDVYVTDRQLMVFLDTLSLMCERCIDHGEDEAAECLEGMCDDLESELDRRAELRENGS